MYDISVDHLMYPGPEVPEEAMQEGGRVAAVAPQEVDHRVVVEVVLDQALDQVLAECPKV